MESNSNNAAPPGDPPAGANEADSKSPQAEALERFRSCRWMQPAEGPNAEYCTHREVKPYAGTTSFDPAAWCPDCAHFKLRRTPKKRPPSDEGWG